LIHRAGNDAPIPSTILFAKAMAVPWAMVVAVFTAAMTESFQQFVQSKEL
jgi:hypothetical protein